MITPGTLPTGTLISAVFLAKNAGQVYTGGDLMRNQLAQFGYLQLLDLLTTQACLMHQVGESNPLVRLLMHSAGSPLGGVVASKLPAFGVAVYCWRRSRAKLLWAVNLFYSAVVVWNLVALLVNHP